MELQLKVEPFPLLIFQHYFLQFIVFVNLLQDNN